MGSDLVTLFLNILMLFLLGATIYFVYRLIKSLDNFKEHRKELDSVIANLLSCIDQADRSVQTLKQASAEKAEELSRMIDQAQALSDELQIINEAGESMAKRLEKLAETNRKIVQPTHARKLQEHVLYEEDEEKISSPVHRKPTQRSQAEKRDSYEAQLKRVDREKNIQKEDLPSFMIKDKDYEDIDSLGNRLDSSVSNDGSASGGDAPSEKLQSQAERDLYDALRSEKKTISKRRR